MALQNVDILIQRAYVLRNRNVMQSLSCLDDALAIAQQAGYKIGMAQIIRDKAACFHLQKQYKKAITSYLEAIRFFSDLNDIKEQLNCLSEIIHIYSFLGDYPSVLTYILQGLNLNIAQANTNGIASSYNDIGQLYVKLSEYDNAIEHFKKALRLNEGLHNKNEMVNGYFLLGNTYILLDDNDKALYYLLRAVNSLEQLESVDARAKTVCGLAILYTKVKDFEKALSHFNDARRLASESCSSPVRAQINNNLGALYIELTQYDKALEVLTGTLRSSEKDSTENDLARIHELLAIAYERIGDFEKALYHSKLHFELDKKIRSEEINLKTKALHIRYDLEELKKQKEIAELSDKLKEQFLANVSHEIRTPMNGVLGMAHLLGKTTPTKEQEEYIDAIKLSANNLMVIINDILDFSKINAGKIEFNEDEFNLRDLAKGILQILSVKAEEKNIQLGCTIDYHLKDNLLGDTIRLNQILTNLMANAVKFTERGKVMLDIKLIEQKENICKIRMKVTDTGIGIPENKLHAIFESFEQAENNKRRYEGTGLGLTIVKQLVELQGGTISVKSRMNEGSEFTVDMTFKAGKPAAKEVITAPSIEITEVLDFSEVAILIVEDNKVNQLLLRNMLRKFGFTNTDTAENGSVALEKLRVNDYDLVLMDIQMPDKDGYEITREIRTKLRKEIRNVPVIAITADASENEKAKAREAGMNDYVVKPFTPEEVYSAILKFIKPQPSTPSRENASVILSAQKDDSVELEFLNRFTGGDLEMTIQLIEIFLIQVPEAINSMSELIPQRKWLEVHAIAHKTKSSIAVFGLHDLKKIIGKIEEFARDSENTEQIPRLFSDLKKGSIISLAELTGKLKVLKARNSIS